MAEALGLASSVIAVVELTGKVAGASIKLINLWKEIKNVPVELLEKVERLRDFEDFLLETESQAASSPLPQQAWNSALLQKYIARTRAVLKDLQDMVDQLYAQVTDPRKLKRKLASTKVVLRKEDLSALDSKLNLALELFKLAREQYLTSLMSYSVMVQLQQSSDIKSIQMSPGQVASRGQTEDNSVDCGTNTNQSLIVKAPAMATFSHRRTMFGRIGLSWKSDVGYKLHAQPPSWLAGSVYSVLAQKSLCGWQLSLRSYEVVEYFSDELFAAMWSDNCPAFFKRLHNQNMSPFVRVGDGSTLLEFAFQQGSLNIIKKLLECGLGSCVLENSSKSNRR
ncbi:hypothetical protein HER10_EVM0008812 [Colletotrichum scovillei]|uniref:uncharacterized protein n=1 Tax=Colletotrichum scovillei TaxID=1209932 RepID=UPI0015C35912|nr:uncharacterized protein HER10_EVM0008812 [Colletotrichum scovillei]KAF4784476.1 hypothetical protein HER10_EVM0008812 [Colletotrichum scovillei]